MHTCVVGLAWGDEGKGKIVDLLCDAHDVVVRFNGGANAGHTVCIGGQRFALHLLPTGVLHPEKISIIGPGVVVDPWTLVEELEGMAARGVQVGDHLLLSDRAHVVMPYHRLEDQRGESAAPEGERIGTTARGIGPCYADKMRRSTAIRLGELRNLERLAPKLAALVDQKRKILLALYGDDGGLEAASILADLRRPAERLAKHLVDSTQRLHELHQAGARILFEAANGTLLDVDHGTYPYVTSSITTAAGVASGAGLPAGTPLEVVGVTKAYTTRVGSGPMVSELHDERGQAIRQRGREYGTTTGRARRCGWLDAFAARYSARLNGVSRIAMMHLDTLSGFQQIGLCTGYRVDGRLLEYFPADVEVLSRAEPVVEMHPGWTDDLTAVRSFADLPDRARRFLERVETLLGAPIGIVSVGPDRSQTIFRDAPPAPAGRTLPASR